MAEKILGAAVSIGHFKEYILQAHFDFFPCLRDLGKIYKLLFSLIVSLHFQYFIQILIKVFFQHRFFVYFQF